MSFTVTILGSSSALPTSKRSLSAHLVNHDERFFLIDCGEGTQLQLRKFRTKFSRINNIFISHHHGDHIFGLFGLLSSYSLMGRKNAINIYAPQTVDEVLKFVFKKLNQNLTFKINFFPIKGNIVQKIYDDEKLEVFAFPLKHRIRCYGFLFKEKPKLKNIRKEAIDKYQLSIKDIMSIKNGADFITNNNQLIPNCELTTEPPAPKSYAYCTDTKKIDSIIEIIKGVDLLYHEATFLKEDEKTANETYHTTTHGAAEIATKANVQKLIIGHFSARYKDDSLFLKETKEIFENTILAEDGLTIEV